MKKIVFMLLLLVLLPSVMAKEGHTTLLAVKETGNGLFEGSVADLYLEIVPGKGRVFMETIPLTKLDTQISTRFAAEVACSYLDEDCSRYDFFYTIKAESNIIGGPSAGAATALLTISLLEDIPIEENIAITGTINAGGMIGPVGGVRAKIDAGIEEDLKKVLIPSGERFETKDNLTLDLKDYAAKKGVDVIETSDLNHAFHAISGKYLKDNDKEISLNNEYSDTMKELAVMLCDRSDILQEGLLDVEDKDEEYVELEETAINLTNRAKVAFKEKSYYSAASYCFGANTKLGALLIKVEDGGDFEELKETIDKISLTVEDVEINTISDLETYMIVRERIDEARESYNKTVNLLKDEEDYSNQFAYTAERAYSAESWSRFFGVEGKKFNFDNEVLEKSCNSKLGEAEERYQFASLYLIKGLENRKELDDAHKEADKGNYELCLFKASKAKANVDSIIGLLGVEEENLQDLLDIKLEIVERSIVEQQEKGVFPIVGYSYYEYANSLRESDVFSALLYSEYALELSNLDMYFKKVSWKSNFNGSKEIALFFGGLLVGLFVMWTVRKKRVERPTKKSSKKS